MARTKWNGDKSLTERIEELVDQLQTKDEMNIIYDAMKEKWNYIKRRDAKRIARTLDVGALVWFSGRRNRTVSGKVTKINQTTANVTADDGVRWKVSLGALHVVELQDVSHG